MQLPERLWHYSPASCAHWSQATTLAKLHDTNLPHPGVQQIQKGRNGGYIISDADGAKHLVEGVVYTAPLPLLNTTIECERGLLPQVCWDATANSDYTGSSKTFVPVDRPF